MKHLADHLGYLNTWAETFADPKQVQSVSVTVHLSVLRYKLTSEERLSVILYLFTQALPRSEEGIRWREKK